MDSKKFCSSDMAKVIVPLHCHSGCDFTSGFYGYGKITVMKQQQKATNSNAVGEKLPITSEITKNLEQFMMKIIYAENFAEARANKWSQMKKNKKTQRLPPDEDSLDQHAARVNYIAYMYNHYYLRDAPASPLLHGYKLENSKYKNSKVKTCY